MLNQLHAIRFTSNTLTLILQQGPGRVRSIIVVTCPRQIWPLGTGISTYDSGWEEEENSIKASKFSEAQIAFALKQAEDGTPIGEVCRKAGISDATFYNWRKKYAELMPWEMKRLRQLEEENAKVKRILADLSLDKAMLQVVLSKKLWGPPASASLSTRSRRTGRSRSGADVRC